MVDLSKIEIHVNKTTNTLRIFSILITSVTVAFLSGLSFSGNILSSLVIIISALLILFGIFLMFVSELYWKILKKYGSTEERLFYFYNADKKTYE